MVADPKRHRCGGESSEGVPKLKVRRQRRAKRVPWAGGGGQEEHRAQGARHGAVVTYIWRLVRAQGCWQDPYNTQ